MPACHKWTISFYYGTVLLHNGAKSSNTNSSFKFGEQVVSEIICVAPVAECDTKQKESIQEATVAAFLLCVAYIIST
jgi:hypothetical protein